MKTNNTLTTVDEMLEKLKAEVISFMFHTREMSEITRRLLLYRSAVAPNFVPWMSNVWVRCKSTVALAACQENLRCEITDNHPAMLDRYVDQAVRSNRLGIDPVVELLPTIQVITALTQRSAIDGLLIMAGLENASLVFIPEMEQWGRDMGFRDFEYVKKHGVADVKHADEFARAVEAESEVENLLPMIRIQKLRENQALHYVREFLYGIFG